MKTKKRITDAQAALLRYMLRENWDYLSPFYPLEAFPQRNNAHAANRRMLGKLAEAGCLKTDHNGRYVIDVAVSQAALAEEEAAKEWA